MEAYSQDLRERVVAAWDRGEGSKTQLARLFGMNERTVRRLIQQRDRTGSVGAGRGGGDNHSKFVGDDRAALRRMHREEPDATLERFRARCRDELGIDASLMAISRTLRAMGLTVKKSR